jgi:hypothetical protein
MCKYPEVVVKLDLSGPDGNAFVVMYEVMAAITDFLENTMSAEEIKKITMDYYTEATAGDYSNLLNVSKQYVKFNDIEG